MPFDIAQFLSQHRIHYVTSGPNTARGELSIACPFCARTNDPDPSQHMGVALDGSKFACWRNRKHSGRRISKLIAAIIGCSNEHARSIVGEKTVRNTAGFAEVMEGMFKTQQKKNDRVTEEGWDIYGTFSSLQVDNEFSERYIRYLVCRGFEDKRTVMDMVRKFDLRYCLLNEFAQRVIIPVKHEGALVAWTGRTIREDEKKRYISSHSAYSASIKDYLLGMDDLGAPVNKTLLLVEGPLDAMKIAAFVGNLLSVTCLFSKDISDAQLSKIHYLLGTKYDRVAVMLDRESQEDSIRLCSRIGSRRAFPISYDGIDVEDPGALNMVYDDDWEYADRIVRQCNARAD